MQLTAGALHNHYKNSQSIWEEYLDAKITSTNIITWDAGDVSLKAKVPASFDKSTTQASTAESRKSFSAQFTGR